MKSLITKNGRWNILLSLLFVSSLTIQAQSIKWYNPMDEAAPVLHGQGWQNELKGSYHRIPARMESKLLAGLWNLSTNSAGEKLVFRTTSPNIYVRYVTTSNSFSMRHMPSTGMSGVDLYAVDAHGKWTNCNPKFNYSFGDTCKYSYKNLTYREQAASNGKGYEFHLYLPLYNGVKWLSIGVEEGSLMYFEKPTQEKPIVIYGTSIAQGACASRPGMAWTNIVERTLEHPILNLGFSGSAHMEPEMQDLLNEVDASLFILDNMENMKAENVYESSLHCCHLLRASHPSTPILLVEHSGQPDGVISEESVTGPAEINAELKKVYQTLQKEGMKQLYYLTMEEIGLDTESFVEGVHPNDYGMMKNAQAITKKIQEIFNEHASALFTPCRQDRDPYNWRARHEDVLRLNAKEAPDVIMIGNSITHYFGGEPKAHIIRGQKPWEEMTKGMKVHNLGYGWDRIENGLWRIYHGELDGYEAKKVFLLLGTNNLTLNTDREIVSGMMELIQAVRERQPKAKIYQCGIMPRHGWGARVQHINQLLQEALATQPNVTYISLDEMGDADGSLKEPYRNNGGKDGTHPNEQGYEVEAKILRKYMVE